MIFHPLHKFLTWDAEEPITTAAACTQNSAIQIKKSNSQLTFKKFPTRVPEPPLLVFLEIVSRHCRRRAGPLCRGGACPAQPPRLVAISRGAPSLPGAKPSWFSSRDFSPPPRESIYGRELFLPTRKNRLMPQHQNPDIPFEFHVSIHLTPVRPFELQVHK